VRAFFARPSGSVSQGLRRGVRLLQLEGNLLDPLGLLEGAV
jgi:hypothetical protein